MARSSTPTLATGTWTSSRGARRALRPPAAAGGFTLIEVMVVVLIIGVVIAGTLLSIGTTGRDSELERERDRLASLCDYVRERAELQTLEYGLRVTPTSYAFVVYDNRTRRWDEDALDTTLGLHRLPVGLDLSLVVEGRKVLLKEPDKSSKLKSEIIDLTPQIMLFSSGDLSDFELTLARAQAGRSVVFSDAADGSVAVGELKVARP